MKIDLTFTKEEVKIMDDEFRENLSGDWLKLYAEVERLKAVLQEITNESDCRTCAGNCQMWEDGKPHSMNDGMAVVDCWDCNGTGKICPINIAKQALAELKETEEKR